MGPPPKPDWRLWAPACLVLAVGLTWLWAWSGVPFLARLVLSPMIGLIFGMELARWERRRRG